ncbi:DUF4276 family protein [Marinobacter sp. LQ44]|uniref:DUF4276 family protein n=1 Tax=Marinobacter sp. LQ44 TaxID=1749259 RepID=UPI000718C320|nr:DUF4276 family protein [Marinobacter sp. LQ44]AMQ90532.1 hypothetical protein ASQ50_18605 [Marinobacter sp. LQ44]
MVKVGFIVEGASERIVVESEMFRHLCRLAGFELVTPVVDAQGGGNLLPQNIDAFISRLENADAQHIFVLTDLEDEASVTDVRDRISDARINTTFVAVKALEAWYLADTKAMNNWLGISNFYEENPEATADKPWNRLKEIAADLGKRGPGNKVAFTKKLVKHWEFSLERAASHPNCPSAKELVEYFSQVAES